MTLKFFDSHCHPQYPRFEVDRDEVLARMEALEIGGLVIGTDLEMSRQALQLAERHNFLWAAIGLHPNDNVAEEFDRETFALLARDPKVVAIGECGLDFYRNEPTPEEKERQIKRFGQHVDLAIKMKKSLMIHCRPTQGSQNANEAMISILQSRGAPRAVMHFFTSTSAIAKRYLELGCYLSFPGVVTFTDMYDDVVRMVPPDRILSETDSPFAAPVPHRGKRNEPSFVIETVKKLAELKGLSFDQMTSQILLNSQKVFGLTS